MRARCAMDSCLPRVRGSVCVVTSVLLGSKQCATTPPRSARAVGYISTDDETVLTSLVGLPPTTKGRAPAATARAHGWKPRARARARPAHRLPPDRASDSSPPSSKPLPTPSVGRAHAPPSVGRARAQTSLPPSRHTSCPQTRTSDPDTGRAERQVHPSPAPRSLSRTHTATHTHTRTPHTHSHSLHRPARPPPKRGDRTGRAGALPPLARTRAQPSHIRRALSARRPIRRPPHAPPARHPARHPPPAPRHGSCATPCVLISHAAAAAS